MAMAGLRMLMGRSGLRVRPFLGRRTVCEAMCGVAEAAPASEMGTPLRREVLDLRHRSFLVCRGAHRS